MTKDELTKELATTEEQLRVKVKAENAIKGEFAKAFNWYKAKSHYANQEEPKNPTWAEIFIELGKKLSRVDLYDFEGNIPELKSDMERAFKEIQDLKEVN